MPGIRNYSIKTKLTWMNMLVSATAVLLAGGGFIGYGVTTYRTSLLRPLSFRAQVVGVSSASALLFNDASAAGSPLSPLQADPDVLFAGVYTLAREPLALYWRANEPHRS